VPSCFGYPDTEYEQNAFFEGYVNLATLTGGGQGVCFARVMLEGRSSQEITAALDDFVGGPLGSVPNCSIAGSNTICSGTSTTFTASGGATGTFTYAWSGPSVTPGTTGAVLSNLTAAGTYSVTVSNPTGCTTACSRTLTVNAPPSCNISGTIQFVPVLQQALQLQVVVPIYGQLAQRVQLSAILLLLAYIV
jgi:hypothetical protein